MILYRKINKKGNKIMENKKTIKKMKEITSLIKSKNIKTAEEEIDYLIDNTEKIEIGANGQIFDFDNVNQMVFYCNCFGKKNNVQWSRNYLSQMYLMKGIIYYDKKEYEKAIQQLKIALKWNPVKIEAYEEILENYIKLKNVAEFEKYFDKALKVALTPLDISILYRKYAFLCIDIKDYEMAYNILKYTVLIYYRKNNEVEIEYLSHILKTNLPKTPDLGTLQYIRENGLEYKPDTAIIKTYMSLAKLYEEDYQNTKDTLNDEQKIAKIKELIYTYDNLYFFNCNENVHMLLIESIKIYWDLMDKTTKK